MKPNPTVKPSSNTQKYGRIVHAVNGTVAVPVDPSPQAPDLSGPVLTGPRLDGNEALLAELERLKAENTQLQARVAQPGRLSIKIQDQERKDKETGTVKPATFAVSVYGLGRFPITLYKSQWRKLIAFTDELSTFLNVNDSKIPDKE